MSERNEQLLKIYLEAAIPVWQHKLKSQPWEYLIERATEAAGIIASQGDLLIERPTKGATAEVFNRLAEGVAILSFLPGGVTFFGVHYEAKHSEST